MKSHHFIGMGAISATLSRRAQSPPELVRDISAMVSAHGLQVVSDHRASFDGGGMTLVWVLAESHLVLHLWNDEGFATLDLHVCDFRRSNAERARGLTAALSELCFVPGTERWREMHLEPLRAGE